MNFFSPQVHKSTGPQVHRSTLLHIQLFRERLSHNSTKAHATMPIGIVGNNSLAPLGSCLRCLARRKERAWTQVYVLFPSLTQKYYTLSLICRVKPPLPITTFDIVAFIFTLLWDNLSRNSCIYTTLPSWSSTSSPGSSLYLQKVCQPKPHRGWVLDLILSTLSREVNVAQTLFWKGSKLFVRYPAWPELRLKLNFYEYEMLIERELSVSCSRISVAGDERKRARKNEEGPRAWNWLARTLFRRGSPISKLWS